MRNRDIVAASGRLKRPYLAKLANIPLGSLKLAFLVTLCAFSFANRATADSAIVINGGNFVSINSGDPNNPLPALYNLAPNQGEIDPLMTFDLSSYSGQINTDGFLTMTDTGLCCRTDQAHQLITSLSLYALTAPYDPNTATWNSVQASGYPAAANQLATADYFIDGPTTQTPVTFKISKDVLQGWANSPSSNFGVIVIESNSWTGDTFVEGAAHSDINYITSGPGSPTLSFDNPTPEPSSLVLIVAGLAGFHFMRRRKRAASF
jgi:hypothetical protein